MDEQIFDKMTEGHLDEDYLDLPGIVIVDDAIEEDEEDDLDAMDPYNDPVLDDEDDFNMQDEEYDDGTI